MLTERQFDTGTVIINYAESVETVGPDMEHCRPTLMASVPRLYEKIFARVLDNVRASSPVRQRIFAWARLVGEAWVDRSLSGAPQLTAGREHRGDPRVVHLPHELRVARQRVVDVRGVHRVIPVDGLGGPARDRDPHDAAEDQRYEDPQHGPGCATHGHLDSIQSSSRVFTAGHSSSTMLK